MVKEKGRQWDGRSRPSDDKYRKGYDRIFGKSTAQLLEEVEVKEKTLHQELMEGFEKEKVGDIELNKDYKKKLVKHLASLDIFEKE